jgi:uncharacterized protein
MELLTGLAFGFLGSLHCVGMCGPLVLAMPAGPGRWGRFITGRLMYNAGRVATYTMLGMIVGYLGEKILFPAMQQRISIVAGVIILAGVVLPRIAGNHHLLPAGMERIFSRLKIAMGKMLQATGVGSLVVLGLLNGLLPCGFVYLGIAGAIATGSTGGGMMFMAGFGFGTIPAMLSVALFPRIMSLNARRIFGRVLPALTLLVGILLIARGLNLGIPYVSPKFSTETTEPDCCH